MISGTVTANREAVFILTIRDANGLEHEREAVVDTGFDGWLSLPSDFIAELGLKWHRFGQAILADGSEKPFNIYRGTVLWDGEPRLIAIYEMDAEPLVGMSLMYGFELNMPILDGSPFTLRRLTEQ